MNVNIELSLRIVHTGSPIKEARLIKYVKSNLSIIIHSLSFWETLYELSVVNSRTHIQCSKKNVIIFAVIGHQKEGSH